MNEPNAITDSELHAYVDKQLDPVRRSEVEAYIKVHPETAALVKDYQLLNRSIQNLYAYELGEDLPEQVVQVKPSQKPKKNKLLKIAASLAWLTAGGLIGLSANPVQLILNQTIDGQVANLVQPASFAHAIYSTEVLHPVEVSASEEEHLIKWLSKRLHTDIKAPDLSKNNYQLIGGRLLPSTNRMAAQFMYQRSDGNRITLYIRRGAWGTDKTRFLYSNRETANVLYWINGEMGYAMSGQVDEAELLSLSQEAYKQMG